MLSEVNKDNPIFISFLLYFVPTPHAYFDPLPHLIVFQNPWSPPIYFNPPPIYYEPESTKYKPQVGHSLSQGVSGITEMGIGAGEGFGPLSRFKIIKV